MKTTMILAAALLLTVSCANAEPSPYTAKKSGWTDKSELPTDLRDALPYRGMLLLSGGAINTARRAKIQLYAAGEQSISEILYSTGPKGSPALKAREGEATRSLSVDEAARMRQLADTVSASTVPFIARPSADINARIILVDDGMVKDIRTYGPPREAVAALYNYAWELIEEGRPALALGIAEAEKMERYRDEKFMSRSVYPTKGGLWNVQFQPGRTDSDINCFVNLKRKSAMCEAHTE